MLRYTSVTAKKNGGLKEKIWERDEGFELLRGCYHLQYEHMLQTLIQKCNAHLLNLLVHLMAHETQVHHLEKIYMLDYYLLSKNLLEVIHFAFDMLLLLFIVIIDDF